MQYTYILTIRVEYSLSSCTYYTKMFSTDFKDEELGEYIMNDVVPGMLREHQDDPSINTSIILLKQLPKGM